MLQAETGHNAWLRYAPLDDAAARQYRETMPAVVTLWSDSPVVDSARQELIRGVAGMLGRTLRVENRTPPQESTIMLGTLYELRAAAPQLRLDVALPPDTYWLKSMQAGPVHYTIVTGANDRGVLYGAFALLRKIALREPVTGLDERQGPYAPVRWVNHWDNLDGSI